MGRTRITVEERIARVEASGMRNELVGARALVVYLETELEAKRRVLAETIERGLEAGLGSREIAAVLDMPFQTLHALARPYSKKA